MFVARLILAVIVAVAGLVISLVYSSKGRANYPEELIQKVIGESGVNINESVFIVTGSTSGIGQSLAGELYGLGGTVVVASRNLDKCRATIKEIQALHSNSAGRLDYYKLDLGDLDTVNPFSEWFRSKYGKLNYLVNNAGIQYGSGQGEKMTNLLLSIANPQGLDEVFVTNYLGHFLLTHNLLSLIQKGRVINVASTYHLLSDGHTLVPTEEGKLPEAADPTTPGFFHRRNSYAVSKLAQILHAKELQRRFNEDKKTNVKAVSLCPGWVVTNILPGGGLGDFIKSFAFSPRAGILNSMMAIFDHSLHGGEFLTNMVPPLVTLSWFPSLMSLLTTIGIRGVFTDLMALAMVVLQSQSYGYYDMTSSPESNDEGLAELLYDWSEKELRRRKYIV
ncbi:SDR family NAD(P)-dependent oxidoreductase [archaeon]|nr:MAG: SDR family NAD(P)-dependent oxidoreductase [archaeon]